MLSISLSFSTKLSHYYYLNNNPPDILIDGYIYYRPVENINQISEDLDGYIDISAISL